MKVHLVTFGAAACLLAVAGCQDEHSPSAEHDHAGHVIPGTSRRRSRTLSGARELRGQIALAASERTGSEAMPIALDIAAWLPEIAADSDMPEQPWNRVNDQASVLLASYEVLGGKRPGDSHAALEAADRCSRTWRSSSPGPTCWF